jgi:hypothetical protein
VLLLQTVILFDLVIPSLKPRTSTPLHALLSDVMPSPVLLVFIILLMPLSPTRRTLSVLHMWADDKSVVSALLSLSSIGPANLPNHLRPIPGSIAGPIT